MPEERVRTQLIADITSLVREGALPEDARAASLTLIGWLARRMPGEPPSRDGVEVMMERARTRDVPGPAFGERRRRRP